MVRMMDGFTMLTASNRESEAKEIPFPNPGQTCLLVKVLESVKKVTV